MWTKAKLLLMDLAKVKLSLASSGSSILEVRGQNKSRINTAVKGLHDDWRQHLA